MEAKGRGEMPGGGGLDECTYSQLATNNVKLI